MPETTPLIKAALNLRGGAGFDVYVYLGNYFPIKMGRRKPPNLLELGGLIPTIYCSFWIFSINLKFSGLTVPIKFFILVSNERTYDDASIKTHAFLVLSI